MPTLSQARRSTTLATAGLELPDCFASATAAMRSDGLSEAERDAVEECQ